MKKIAFLTSLIFLLNSCSQQDVVKPVSDDSNSAITIEEAKAYYISNSQKARTSENDKGKIIFWDDFKEFKGEDGFEYMSIPYVDTSMPTVKIEDSTLEKKENPHFTGDIATYLVFRKVDNNIEGYKLHLIRSEESYKGKKSSNIDKRFTGYSLLYDLSDKRIELSIYSNGELTHTSLSDRNGRPNNYATVCVTYAYYVCYPDGNGGTTCTTTQYDTICESVYVGNGGNGGSIGFTTTSGVSGMSNLIQSLSQFQDIEGFYQWYYQLKASEIPFYLGKPQLVIPAITSYIITYTMTDFYFCNQGDGNNSNAFKHMFWNMLNAQLVGPHNAIDMGMVHEIDEPDDVFTEMDLQNNMTGILRWYQVRSALNPSQGLPQLMGTISGIVLSDVDSGVTRRVVNNNLTATDSSGKCN